MADQLEAIVQKMIDANESEENIATVIQHFRGTEARKQSIDSPMSYLADTVSNLGPSALRAGKEMISAVPVLADAAMHPVDKLLPMVMEAPMAVGRHFGDRYGSSEARALTVRDDPFGMVTDMAGAVGGGKLALAAARKGIPAAVRGTGVLLDEATKSPERAAILSGLGAYAATKSPYVAAGAAAAAANGNGLLNRAARGMRTFRQAPEPPVLPLPPGPTTPLRPASAGVVLPQPLRNDPLSLIKGMGKAGRSELDDITANERMVSGMGAPAAAVPPGRMVPGSAPTLEDSLRQMLDEIRAGEAPTGVELPDLGAPSVQLSDKAKRIAGVPAPSVDEGLAFLQNIRKAQKRSPEARSARGVELSDLTDDFAAEFRARQSHGVGGFSRLPNLPPGELARIQATLDAILKRRSNPY